MALTGCIGGPPPAPVIEYVEIRCPDIVPVVLDDEGKPVTCPDELEEWTGAAAYQGYLKCRAVAETAMGVIEACGD